MSVPELRRIRVVVAEDHDQEHDAYVEGLRAHRDVEIVGEAWDPDEALQVVTRTQPDVVLFDLKYTGWDPATVFEAIRKMRREAPRTRVLALTAYGDRFGEAARQAGCDRILEKVRGVGARQVHDAIVALGNSPREERVPLDELGLTKAEASAFLAHVRTGDRVKAARLRHVQPNTQRQQEQKIREKMAARFGEPVPNMGRAIAPAFKYGLIDRDTFQRDPDAAAGARHAGGDASRRPGAGDRLRASCGSAANRLTMGGRAESRDDPPGGAPGNARSGAAHRPGAFPSRARGHSPHPLAARRRPSRAARAGAHSQSPASRPRPPPRFPAQPPNPPTTRRPDYPTIRLPDYPTIRLPDYSTIRLPDYSTI
jgi:DNA-binding NarL/FixJ family response regulator